jgi:hypothetical protein
MSEHAPRAPHARTYAWWLVLCLVGLDYFSTLAYLPSVAVFEVRALAPVAGFAVVAITLLAALPVYAYVVGRSPHGRGATGLLESRLHGWRGKLLILVVLGFLATDFVITRTLSVADASTHLRANPLWREHSGWVTQHREQVRAWFPEPLRGRFFDFWDEQLVLTVVLSVLAFGLYAYLVRSMSRGFLKVAVAVVLLYLLLNALVIGSGLVYLAGNPAPVAKWREALQGEWGGRGETPLKVWALLGLLHFPALALGLSGFELSAASAPLVRGNPDDDPEQPRGRVRNTRKLLVAAALLMSVFLLGAMWVVTVLVPRDAIVAGAGPGGVEHRALAYLAHGGKLEGASPLAELNPLFGPRFGSLYDLSAILILCLAGASATVAMRDVVPEFLSRFGMQLEWAHKVGVILHLFNVVILLVTIAFRASVSAQLWAYASSVLVLLVTASLASYLDARARSRGPAGRLLLRVPFGLICLLFLCMFVLMVVQNVTGLGIALGFVAVVMVTAFVSRWLRSTELRFQSFAFADEATKERWERVCRLDFQVLVPHLPGHHTLKEKEEEIRKRHRLGPEVPILFVEVQLGDPSDFYNSPLMKIEDVDGREVIRVSRCTSVAHVLAAMGLAFREVGEPPEIHFGWSNESPHAANLNFLLFGQGNVPWLVHGLLVKAEPDERRRPRVIVG